MDASPFEFLNTISLGLLSLLALYVAYKFLRAIRFVPQQNAYVVERLGNYHKTLGAGFHALVPFIDRVAYTLDLREKAIPVEPQECFTMDNVRVEVDGIIYLSVTDPENAAYGVTDYRRGAIQLAQTTTRSVIGRMELDTTFQDRAAISQVVVWTPPSRIGPPSAKPWWMCSTRWTTRGASRCTATRSKTSSRRARCRRRWSAR
jgi:regulator of protease activity HflC (stomatin/prohibitin superfamily)